MYLLLCLQQQLEPLEGFSAEVYQERRWGLRAARIPWHNGAAECQQTNSIKLSFQLTFGSFVTLGILNEAIVDILALRGIVEAEAEVGVRQQRFKDWRLLNPLVAILKSRRGVTVTVRDWNKDVLCWLCATSIDYICWRASTGSGGIRKWMRGEKGDSGSR